MKDLNWIVVISIVLATITLTTSIINIFIRIKTNQNLQKKIKESNIRENIEKIIRKRNANTQIKKRELTSTEINSVILKLESYSKELSDSERKYFDSIWIPKSQKNKFNYLIKIISNSDKEIYFEKIERKN